MDFMDNDKVLLLDKLLNTFGPSGNEEDVSKIIEKEIESHVDEIHRDAMGNLIAFKKGKGKKIMISAHMDEIGLIITHIDQNGFLRFSNIGGVSHSLSNGQRVQFKNGTIGFISNEHLDEKEDLKLEKLFIDIGVSNKEEAENKVSIGDVVSFYGPLVINNNRGFSKAMDNRISCFVLIEIIKRIKNNNNNIYFVFTVQEELGIRGAKTSAYRINPDLGIAVDVTKTGDTPKAQLMEVSLGNGPAIKILDASIICHPKVKELLISTAIEFNIPYQLEVLEKGGTDAGAIHLTRDGIPTGAVSIPTRYIHSPGEMVDFEDVKNAIQLLIKFLEKEIN
jgi:endoglucanase